MCGIVKGLFCPSVSKQEYGCNLVHSRELVLGADGGRWRVLIISDRCVSIPRATMVTMVPVLAMKLLWGVLIYPPPPPDFPESAWKDPSAFKLPAIKEESNKECIVKSRSCVVIVQKQHCIYFGVVSQR